MWPVPQLRFCLKCYVYTISRKSMLSRPLALPVLTLMFHGGLIPPMVISIGNGRNGWALIIPGCTSGIFMVIMANAFRNVPDISRRRRYYFTIMFQVVLPHLEHTVIILNTVILHWNSWIRHRFMFDQRNLWPIQLWIKEILAQTNLHPSYRPTPITINTCCNTA